MSQSSYITSRIRILMVEDSLQDELLIQRQLKKNGFDIEVKRVDTIDDLKMSLVNERWNLLLSDFYLPGFDTFDVLKVVEECSHETLPVIVVSGAIGEEKAVDIMRAGASDFVMKDRLLRLPVVVDRVLKEVASQQQSREELQLLANSMPQIVWTAKSDGTIDYYNDRIQELMGAKRNPDGSWNWTAMLHDEDVEKTVRAWEEAVKSQTPYSVEHRVRTADGSYRWYLSRGTPVVKEDGNVRWYGTATDIDEQKKIQKALHEALVARDEFLSVASHELKTPLTSLSLQFQLQKRGMAKKDPSFLGYERISQLTDLGERLTKRLNVLVEDMLDVSRIRTGNLSIIKKEIDLSEVFQDVLERMTPVFTEANYQVPMFHQKEVKGSFDPYRMEQVFTNLISNAIRYGNGNPIEVEMFQKGNEVHFSLKDHGRGIPEEMKDKIFDRFERAVDSNKISGLGLGLYIAKKIIEAHEGQIWVESEPEKGSTFHVILPL